MYPRLFALALFATKTDALTGAERTELNYGEIAVSIFLKFIDVIEGVVIIAVGIFLMRIAKRYFSKIETTHERQRTALNLLEKIVSGFIAVISVTLGLKVVGLDLTLIVSVLTLGISFGLRDVIKNYVAGLLILFKSPFEIGDIVKIRTFTGHIEKIDFQSVTLRTFDRREITIHNSDLLTQPLTNYSKTQQVRLELSLKLGYGSDVQRALKIFDKLLQNNPAVLKTPKYSILLKEFSVNSVEILLRFWVQRPCNFLRIRSELALQIQEAFDEENIFTPYNREAGLEAAFGMTEGRKQRLKMFYGQPLLAEMAVQTATQVAVATAAPTDEFIDADEPE